MRPDAASIETEMHQLNHETGGAVSSSETAQLICSVALDDEDLAAKTVARLNKRILPWTALIVMLSYIDRGNLGFVAADVCSELGMSHAKYGFGVGMFGTGYVLSQVPSNYFLRRCGANVWFAFLMGLWGIVAASFAFMQNRAQFYILRFLLGMAEGGTFPGVWYFLSTFYPAAHLTYPYASVGAAISISTPLAAPMAVGLLSLEGVLGFEGWRLLFFVEGLLPIIYGAFLLWFLPPSPARAAFLTQEQKTWIVQQEMHVAQHERNVLREVCTVFKNKSFWIITFTSLIRGSLLTAAFYWTTLIIDHMLNGEDDDKDGETCASSESTNVAAVALTAVPFTICAVFSLYFGHLTSKVRNRSRVAGTMLGVAGVFLIGWVLFNNMSFPVGLACLSLAISCFVSPAALIVGLVGSFFDKETRATAVALFNTMEGFGQIVGPFTLGVVVDSHGYGLAVTVLASLAFLGGLALLTVKDPLSPSRQVVDTQEDVQTC